MSDRIVESDLAEVPEIPELVETVLIAALNEARAKLEAGEDVIPFTALAVKDTLFIETHPGADSDECFASARHTVSNASGAGAYALCYDGYVDTDGGQLDALIAEGGRPGEPEGYAVGYVYEMPEGDGFPQVTTDAVYIGPAPNFMALATPAGYYAGGESDDGDAADDATEKAGASEG